MSDPSVRTFSSDFKRFFVRGLVVLLPTVLTLWIVVAAYQFIDHRIAEPINRGVRLTVNKIAPYWEPLQSAFNPSETVLNAEIAERAVARGPITRDEVRRDYRRVHGEDPSEDVLNAAIAERAIDRGRVNPAAVQTELRQRAIDEWWGQRWYMGLIGLIIAIIGVYTAGRLLGGYFGRQIYRRLETLLATVPVFKQVYPYVKQIVDFLFNEEQQLKFSRVVVTEYPRKGIWSLGFMTGPSLSAIADRAGDSVTIFIPSSPTPFTGYTITVPRAEVIEVPISVEEAIRFAVSAGVLVPDHQLVLEAKTRKAALEAAEGSRGPATAGTAATGSQPGGGKSPRRKDGSASVVPTKAGRGGQIGGAAKPATE